MFKPEQLPLGLKADPIDAEIDSKCDNKPRCEHCGMMRVKCHGLLCVSCVRRLIIGLQMIRRVR